jgi:hypothetical protein
MGESGREGRADAYLAGRFSDCVLEKMYAGWNCCLEKGRLWRREQWRRQVQSASYSNSITDLRTFDIGGHDLH